MPNYDRFSFVEIDLAVEAPHLERYWGEADPTYCDGEGAESFGTLLRRAEAELMRLAARPPSPLSTCSAIGSLFRLCAPSSQKSDWTIRPRCAVSGARVSRP